jgi:hypothetical protein
VGPHGGGDLGNESSEREADAFMVDRLTAFNPRALIRQPLRSGQPGGSVT